MPLNPYFTSDNLTQGSDNEQMVLSDLIEESINKLKKPTVLYIKEHSKTGLRYFGKTTNIDEVCKYMGSGKHWKRHVNIHGKEFVKTIWVSEVFTSYEDLNEFALFFSSFFDITNSKKWANLKEETGVDGGAYLYGDDNPSRRIDVRKKISESLKGHKGVKNTGFLGRMHSEETKEKIRNTHLGVKWSAERCEKMRLSDYCAMRPSKTCEHCGKTVKVNIFPRFHGANCKKYKEVINAT